MTAATMNPTSGSTHLQIAAMGGAGMLPGRPAEGYGIAGRRFSPGTGRSRGLTGQAGSGVGDCGPASGGAKTDDFETTAPYKPMDTGNAAVVKPLAFSVCSEP